jgi:hypothetical protein
MVRGYLKLPHAGWEITVTVDDMSSLLHLPIEGHLLDHIQITRYESALLMVQLLRAKPTDADKEVAKTKGAHGRTTLVLRYKVIFKTRLQHITDFIEEGNDMEVQRHQNNVIRVYLLFSTSPTRGTFRTWTWWLIMRGVMLYDTVFGN